MPSETTPDFKKPLAADECWHVVRARLTITDQTAEAMEYAEDGYTVRRVRLVPVEESHAR